MKENNKDKIKEGILMIKIYNLSEGQEDFFLFITYNLF